MIHTGEKPHECDVCQKRLSSRSALKTHKMIHTGEKPYECDVCQKRFSQRGSATVHKRIHTGKKSHKCLICNKAFLTSSNLRKHNGTHLKDELLLCISCGREIMQSQEQHSEEISNSNHDCDVCKKQFPDLKKLKLHKAKDHRATYQCHVCIELDATEPTGIGYICFICDAEFDIASELEKHMDTH